MAWARKIILYMVYANVVWDFISAAAIVVDFEMIGSWHTDMWKSQNDRSNPAAQNLMGWFVLTFGTARLAAALNPPMYTSCGIVPYIIEGCFASAALMNQSIKPLEGWAVALSSFAFAAALPMI
jgi:hypothetical protein